MNPPRFLFLATNQRGHCNLHCGHCNFWQDKVKVPELSIERRNEIIEEFAELAEPGAAVVTCGGESLIDGNEYFSVTRKCRKVGLRCLSVFNGSFVEQCASRLIVEGPSEILVSLDSPFQSVHDGLRGKSFEAAVTGIRRLLEVRKGSSKWSHAPRWVPKIYVMAIVSERNYRDLDDFYDLVLNELGADKLKLNFLQPTFGGGSPDDFFSENVIKSVGGLLGVLRRCDEKYKLRLNPKWIDAVAMYHRSVAENDNAIEGWSHQKGTREHICNSYERNIMVDLGGLARLCYYPSFSSQQLSSPGDLKNFWEGAHRGQMKTCNRYCGISHSVRRESATRRSP